MKYFDFGSLFFQVEILTGKDRGKQGIINSVVMERNWCFVEGLNCVSILRLSTMYMFLKGIQFLCVNCITIDSFIFRISECVLKENVEDNCTEEAVL